MDDDNKETSDVELIREKEQQLKRITLMYESALKEMETKIKIISDEFRMLYNYNPIEHIESRIKTPESIIRKCRKRGYPITYKSIVENINDIAGIRIICSFIPNIYKIIEMFENSKDITIIKKKDYIKNPKENGYSSFHIIALVPVSFACGISEVKVEIQIRTIAMDFWASLEHKIKYKYPKELPENIFDELKECSCMINELDKKMSNLGGNLIEEFEQDLLFNKDLQSKEIKMPDCYTTQVINKIIDSF